MDRLISELEGLMADLSFRGVGESGGDIVKRLELVRALCGELGMAAGEALCGELLSSLGGERDEAVRLLCALGCYCECVRENVQKGALV